MRIVIFEKEEQLRVGGIVIHNQRLKGYLKKLGHRVKIIRFSNENINSPEVTTIPYYLAEKRTYIFLPQENTRELVKKELEKFKPDIVHFCVGISPFDFFIPLLCHALKIPVVGIWHSDLPPHEDTINFLLKSIYLAYLPVCKQLDSLIVFTPRLRDFYVKKGIKNSRVNIIPNGINCQTYAPGSSSLQTRFGKTTNILFLARITLVKNPETLIEAFRELNLPQTRLIIAGTGDLEEELKEKYRKDRRIIFTGLISNEKHKVDLLRASQIFVLPSKHEGMSLSLLEAMSCGLACIATNAGGNSDLLGRAGIIVDTNNLESELPLALKILLQHREFQKVLGQEARSRVLLNFEEEKTFNKYLALYKKVIRQFKKEGPPKAISQELYSVFRNKFKNLWKKAKNFGENYLLG